MVVWSKSLTLKLLQKRRYLTLTRDGGLFLLPNDNVMFVEPMVKIVSPFATCTGSALDLCTLDISTRCDDTTETLAPESIIVSTLCPLFWNQKITPWFAITLFFFSYLVDFLMMIP